MKFCTTLIAVKDMERSLHFYRELFNQEVVVDLGWNKTLTCGLTLQEHFDRLAGIQKDTMKYHSNTMELSESMYSVVCKQFKQGKSVEETAELIEHPLNVVQVWYDEYQAEIGIS